MLDTTDKIDLIQTPCNILIRGTARTGKTYLSIQIIEQLLASQISVTLVECTRNPGSLRSDYAELFQQNDGRYQDIKYDRDLNEKGLLYGIGIQEDPQCLINISDDEIILYLQKRLQLFNRSFLFVDEISAARPGLQDFFVKVLNTRAKHGVHNIHISTLNETILNKSQYDRVILLEPPTHRSCTLDIKRQQKIWELFDRK